MCMPRLWWVSGIVVLLVVAGVWPAIAQLPTYHLGRAPTDAEVEAWDLTIPPDGEGLPPGSGSAVLGKPIYEKRCASCHGDEKGKDAKYTPLVGGQGSLGTAKPKRTVGSFWPYAPVLWSYLRRTQPFDTPGSLTTDQVYAVTAYLLYINSIIGEHEVINATTLPLVEMPNRNGFVTDPRPDVGPTAK